MQYDFAVIGAGVTGAWISYYLSQYDVKACLIEKGNDVCVGSSKANSAIVHAGYDPVPGSLKARLNVRGNELIHSLNKQMSIPFKPIGSLVLAFDESGLEKIKDLYERGVKNGVPGMKLLSKAETFKLEPNLSETVVGSLYAPSAGVCSSFELCIAPAEVAVKNGVEFIRNFKVNEINKKDGHYEIVSEDGMKVEAKTIINAAGLHADHIASLMGDNSFKIFPRKGEYSILDHSVKGLVSHVIFQTPTAMGKGILVSPTVDDNVLVGPNAENIQDKDDLDTSYSGQKAIFDGARRSVPSVSERDVITSFSGLRSISGESDFIISRSKANEDLFNAAGIESPGLTSSPAIGEYLIELLKDAGYQLVKKDHFDGTRKVTRFNELTDEEKDELIKKDSSFGRIICRCETVSEGEIIESINRPVGARDLDGVKRRVRAGMGRCQGGFCSPRVISILSRELNIPMSEVTKFGGDSWMVDER